MVIGYTSPYSGPEIDERLRRAGDSVQGVKVNGVEAGKDEEGKVNIPIPILHPYLSLERFRKYLYRVTFDSLPQDNGGDNLVVGACSSFVSGGKLYRNLDFLYDNAASFIVRTKDFEGMSFVTGLNDGQMDDDKIARLPYRMVDGRNNNGIMVAVHVLFNDWSWTGAGDKSISLTRLPFLVLSNVKSMATIATDLSSVLGNLKAIDGTDYILQCLVTDGTTTYAIIPPTADNQAYELVDATSYPKMSNFRYVARAEVSRYDIDMQTRPTGIERFNAMPCALSDLRFTKAYEDSDRLSEFIGINETTKESTDSELLAIYQLARSEYLVRQRDGKTWQTMHSVVYGDRMEHLYIQENWNDDIIASGVSKEYVDQEILRVEGEIPAKTSDLNNDSGFQTESEVDAKVAIETTRATAAESALDTNKVDKVTGKGLSTNDYTTGEKNKLGALPTRQELNAEFDNKQGAISDLATIRSNASAGKDASDILEVKGLVWDEKADLDDIPEIIDNVTSTATDKTLSAHQGKQLNDRINNIATRGRFLSLWDCTTGLPMTNPSGYPYAYQTGDFFIVSRTGESNNLIPNGATYTGQPSATVYSGSIKVNDSIFYDGTSWSVLDTPAGSGEVQDVYQNGVSVLSNGIAYVVTPTLLSQLAEDISHRLVTDIQIAAWNAKGTYSKPASGIPSTDLDSSTQQTLNKVGQLEQALEEDEEIVAEALVELDEKLTDLELNQGDLDELETTEKTNLVGAINEVKGEADDKADKVAVASSIPANGLLPNTLYNVGTLTGAVTINLATPTDSTIMNIYHICFEAGATAPTITWDANITSWMGGSAPTINANKHYEISVLNGVGVAMEV